MNINKVSTAYIPIRRGLPIYEHCLVNSYITHASFIDGIYAFVVGMTPYLLLGVGESTDEVAFDGETGQAVQSKSRINHSV